MEQDEWLHNFDDLKECDSSSSVDFQSWLQWKPIKNELVVSKRKIADLEIIIDKAKETTGLLVIDGPPGSGKLSVLRSLCDASGIFLKEWQPSESTSYDYANEIYESETASLEKFLRNSIFENVDTECDNDILPTCFILIKPTYCLLHNSENFCRVIHKYLSIVMFTIVIIFDNSELQKTCLKSLERWFCLPVLVWRLSFGQISSSSLRNLARQIKKHFKISNSEWPKMTTLDTLIEICMGDARRFLNELYFLVRTSIKLKDRRKRDFVFSEHTVLTVFRAMGKLLYAKRKLVHDRALLPLESNIEANRILFTDPSLILKTMDVSMEFFAHMIFCNYLYFVLDIESIAFVSDYFCHWNIYMSCWNDVHHNLDLHKYACTLFLSLSITHKLASSQQHKMKTFFAFKSQDYYAKNKSKPTSCSYQNDHSSRPYSNNPNYYSKFILDDYSDILTISESKYEMTEEMEMSSVSIDDFSD